MSITIETVGAYFASEDRPPLFSGALIDGDGCCCAQGYVLRLSGMSDDELRNLAQINADREVARLLGISIAHSCLLRVVNDRKDGCPQDVLLRPERVLGNRAQQVLKFWWLLDGFTPTKQWTAARTAAWAAARTAAAWATNEIQGGDIIRKRGQSCYFLPMFGINDPAELGR